MIFLITVGLSILSHLLPLVVWILTWKLRDRKSNLIFSIALSSLVLDIVGVSLALNSKNNIWVGNAYMFSQFVFLALVFKECLDSRLFRSLGIAGTIFVIVDLLVISGPNEFNSYTSYVPSILMIFFAIWCLYGMVSNLSDENVQSLPFFWLSFGVLIYYGGTLFLFLFNSTILKYLPTLHRNVWILHNILNITKNFFLFMTLWVNYKSKTSQS